MLNISVILLPKEQMNPSVLLVSTAKHVKSVSATPEENHSNNSNVTQLVTK